MSQVTINDKRPDSRGRDEAFLVARGGGVWRDIFRLPRNVVTTIGRDPSNRIVLNEEKCSRRQCELSCDANQWMICDLNSRNGTRVNGDRISERIPISDGDVIRIGQMELLFTTDISKPLDQTIGGADDELQIGDDTSDDTSPQILERKSNSRFMTESHVAHDARESSVRGAFAALYRLVVRMVSATSLRDLSETVLEQLLKSVNADIGAVLLFPPDAADRTDPNGLRIISYRAPDDAPYQKVSTALSRLALTERQNM